MDQKPKHDDAILRREALFRLGAGLGLGLGLAAPAAVRGFQGGAPEVPELPTFFFTQIVYGNDLSWNPYPTAARGLMEALTSRTSVAAAPDRVDIRLTDPKLFQYPFLYWTGTREFDPLSEEEVRKLKFFIDAGGFLLVDDALSAAGTGFDKAFLREAARIFPGEALKKLPEDHTVFMSYYLLDKAVGRTANRTFLTGIDRGDRTVLMYSGNDMGGAWARDSAGRHLNPCNPGGENQREMALRLGVNIIMYALCLNYKRDNIHTPFISERRKGKK
jgi:hypothetical protein